MSTVDKLQYIPSLVPIHACDPGSRPAHSDSSVRFLVNSGVYLHQDSVRDVDEVEVRFMIYEPCLLARDYLS